MAQTLAEQILSNAAGRPVQAGENVVVNVDMAMMHDSISPSIIKVLHGELGAERVWDPERIAVVVDHVAPAATIQNAEHQANLRRWVREQGISHLYDVGRGISHPVLVEENMARPGMLIIGSDSHSTGYGSVGAFGTGMGTTDMALALATGQTWLRVPETVRVQARGRFQPGVSAKDLGLRVAREIQTALLPGKVPNLPGWDLAADWRSARLVGGDFYDFWRLTRNPEDSEAASVALNSQPLGFVVADVSDKGIPAAMFMTLSRSLVRAAALDGSSPSVALARANRWITRDSESAMFVTLFYGVVQPNTGVLRFSCAGHNPPLLFRAADGTVSELTTPGMALGVLEEAPLSEAEAEIAAGDVLVCYTDGLTEAINGEEEAFGVPRLREVIAEHHADTAAELVGAINAALRHFSQRPPFDDLTLVVLKRLP